jgi:hypothetical protein
VSGLPSRRAALPSRAINRHWLDTRRTKNAQLGQILTLTQVKALTAMMLTLEALDRYCCRADLAKRMRTKRLAKREPDVKQAPLR